MEDKKMKVKTVEDYRKEGKTKFIFLLDIEDYDRLEDEAKQIKLSKAEVVRAAIKSYFEMPTKEKLYAKLEQLISKHL